jgi:hypothetical protein
VGRGRTGEAARAARSSWRTCSRAACRSPTQRRAGAAAVGHRRRQPRRALAPARGEARSCLSPIPRPPSSSRSASAMRAGLGTDWTRIRSISRAMHTSSRCHWRPARRRAGCGLERLDTALEGAPSCRSAVPRPGQRRLRAAPRRPRSRPREEGGRGVEPERPRSSFSTAIGREIAPGAAPADRADHRQRRDDPHPARRDRSPRIQQLRRRHRQRRASTCWR